MLRVLDNGILSDDGTSDLGNDTFVRAAQGLFTELYQGASVGRFWHHLIYAYLVENTGIERIFRRLLQLALHGESLGGISEAGHRWLRNTEDLFYRDGNSSFIPSITSWLRPDAWATRRNAYHRMLGVDLNHATDDRRPVGRESPEGSHKAEAHNHDFIATFEEFLREVWAAYTNATNTSGPKTTDKAAIAELAARLSQMLNDRRQHGNLTREEYVSVCAMSWFHLTGTSASPGSERSDQSNRSRFVGDCSTANRSFLLLRRSSRRLMRSQALRSASLMSGSRGFS
jgi:hypothetical protein